MIPLVKNLGGLAYGYYSTISCRRVDIVYRNGTP